jgi:hypothetical protein
MTTDNEASWCQPNGTLNPGVDKKKTEVARAAACEQAYDVATGAHTTDPKNQTGELNKLATAKARQAACETAYEVFPNGEEQPLRLGHRDSFRSGLTPGSSLRCGCTGSHVRCAQPPKLEGQDSKTALERILASKEWKGSTVEEARRSVAVSVAVIHAGRKFGYKPEMMMCDVFVVRHPGGAELTLRANLGLPEVKEKEEVAVTYLHGQKPTAPTAPAAPPSLEDLEEDEVFS